MIFDGIRDYIANSKQTTGRTFHVTMTYFWIQIVHFGMRSTVSVLGSTQDGKNGHVSQEMGLERRREEEKGIQIGTEDDLTLYGSEADSVLDTKSVDDDWAMVSQTATTQQDSEDDDSKSQEENNRFHHFLLHNPHVADDGLWADYYSKDVMMNPKAKTEMVLPDKRPLPSLVVRDAIAIEGRR